MASSSASSSQEHSEKMNGSGTSSTAATSEIPEKLAGVPERWFFSNTFLREVSPTLKAGADVDKELYYRQQAAGYVYELGGKLQLSSLVMNVALVFMHRFYVFHSFRRFSRPDMAAACIFLAGKVEEMPRKLEYIVKISYALQHRDKPNLDVRSSRYNEDAQRIITYENILLQTLGFDLHVPLPHQYVVRAIQMVKAPKELAQAAYHFTNDCLHLTTLCLRYRPAVIACASIFLACSWAKWEIPTSQQENMPWYYYVDSDVTKELLEVLADEIVTVYQKCPERLRIKRHLPARDGASTSDMANGLEVESPLYNHITACISAASRHQTTPSKIKIEVGVDQQKKSEINLDFGTSGTSSKANPTPTPVVATNICSNASSPASVKRELAFPPPMDFTDSPEPKRAKVDLKSYRDQKKERKQEQDTSSPSNAPTLYPMRKSFMPDVSLGASKDDAYRKNYDSRSNGGSDRHYHQNHHDQNPHRSHHHTSESGDKRGHAQQRYSGTSGSDASGSGHRYEQQKVQKPEISGDKKRHYD